VCNRRVGPRCIWRRHNVWASDELETELIAQHKQMRNRGRRGRPVVVMERTRKDKEAASSQLVRYALHSQRHIRHAVKEEAAHNYVSTAAAVVKPFLHAA